MSDLEVQGKVIGIKPRGQSQGFWTAEIDSGSKYPVKISFHQFHKDSEESTGYYELLNQAMSTRQQVLATYYETEGDFKGKPITYRNGTHFEFSDEGTAASPPPVSDDDGWGPVPSAVTGTTAAAPSHSSYDDREAVIGASWATGKATDVVIEVSRRDGTKIQMESIYTIASELLVVRDRIISELKG